MEVRSLVKADKKTVADMKAAVSQTGMNQSQINLLNGSQLQTFHHQRPTTNSIRKRKHNNQEVKKDDEYYELEKTLTDISPSNIVSNHDRTPQNITFNETSRMNNIYQHPQHHFNQSSQQILVNVLCNTNPEAAGGQISAQSHHLINLQPNIDTGKQSKFDKQHYNDHSPYGEMNRNVWNHSKKKKEYKKIMKKTLSSQTNCFLPNYKKNTMMKRYQAPYQQSQEFEKQDKEQFKPFRNKSQEQVYRKKIKKNKQVNLTVINSMPQNKDNAILEPILNVDILRESPTNQQDVNKSEKIIRINTHFNDNLRLSEQNSKLTSNFNTLQRGKEVGSSSQVIMNNQSSSQGVIQKIYTEQSIEIQNINHHHHNNNMQIIAQLDQNSSKMSLQEVSPMNTDFANYDDVRLMQPRNHNNLMIINSYQKMSIDNDKSIFVRNDLDNVSETGKQSKLSKSPVSKTQRLNISGEQIQIVENRRITTAKHKRNLKSDEIQKDLNKSDTKIFNVYVTSLSGRKQNQLLNQTVNNNNKTNEEINSFRKRITQELNKSGQKIISYQNTMPMNDQVKDSSLDQHMLIMQDSEDYQQFTLDHFNKDYASRSIEVIIQRTSNSNSKITSMKESTPNNIQYRNIYGNSGYVLTPSNNKSITKQHAMNNESRQDYTTQQQIQIEQNQNKKIILKKQQVKQQSIDYNDRQVARKKSSPPGKKISLIMNNDLLSYGVSIERNKNEQLQYRVNQQPRVQFLTENINSNLLSKTSGEQYMMMLPTEQINRLTHQHSNEMLQNLPGIASSAPFESVTQDSQMQNGIYINRYEDDGGSPIIYQSKNDTIFNEKIQNQHLTLENNHSKAQFSNSVTPIFDPVYLNINTSLSKSRDGNETNLLNEIDHKEENIEGVENNDVNKSVQTEPDETVVIVDSTTNQFQQQITLIDQSDELQNGSSSQNYYIQPKLHNLDMPIEINATFNNVIPLSKYIEEKRQEYVQPQIYKYMNSNTLTKQEEEEKRLLQSRLKKNREMQLQTFCVQGTNIKTIGQKMVEQMIINSQYPSSQNFIIVDSSGKQLRISNETFINGEKGLTQGSYGATMVMPPVLRQIDSMSNSDALIQSHYGLINTSSNPYTFLQNKYSISQQNNLFEIKNMNSQGLINSDIYIHQDMGASQGAAELLFIQSPPPRNEELQQLNLIQQQKITPKNRRYLSNEESKRFLISPGKLGTDVQTIGDPSNAQNESVIQMKSAKYYSPTPAEPRNVMFFQEQEESMNNASTQKIIMNQSKENTNNIMELTFDNKPSNENTNRTNFKFSDQRASYSGQAEMVYENQTIKQYPKTSEGQRQSKIPKFTYPANISSQQNTQRGKTFEESDRTSYKITKPIMFKDEKEVAFTPQKKILNKDLASYQLSSQIDPDDAKMAKSYSRMMKGIGEELKNVGPRSLKNLNYLQNQRIMTNTTSEMISTGDLRKQMPQTAQASKKRHEIYVNITASVSTASFKNENNHNKRTIGDRSTINDEMNTTNNIIKIKQSPLNKSFNNDAAPHINIHNQTAEGPSGSGQHSHSKKRFMTSMKSHNHYQNSYFNFQERKNSNGAVFEDIRDSSVKNALLMKNSKLQNRLAPITKNNLQHSFVHQNRKLLNSGNMNSSFQNSNTDLRPQAQYGAMITNFMNNHNKVNQSENANNEQDRSQTNLNDVGITRSVPKYTQSNLKLTANSSQRPMTAYNQQNCNPQRVDSNPRLNLLSSQEISKKNNTVYTPNSQNTMNAGTYSGGWTKNTIGKTTQNKNSISANKLQTFKRLKKGNVFKDQDFEAKCPGQGIKIYSRY